LGGGPPGPGLHGAPLHGPFTISILELGIENSLASAIELVLLELSDPTSNFGVSAGIYHSPPFFFVKFLFSIYCFHGKLSRIRNISFAPREKN
jgi:hypothetical protein